MNDDELGQLLTAADRAASPPNLAKDLSTRVRTRLRRRQVSVRLAAVGLPLVLAAVVGTTVHSYRRSRVFIESTPALGMLPIDQLRAEVVQLASDAAVHERVADALLSAREQSLRQQKWRQALAATSEDPGRVLEEARNRAAEILVRDADRMPADSQGALREYRHVAQLFPNTPAGRQALLKLKSEGV
jgi:hypothetical protein